MGKLRPQLGVIEVMALSVGIMAPTAAMALNGSLAASITGTAVALAFLGAVITIGLTSYSFIEFSRQFAHAGSVYVFNGISFGARMGFLSAWGLLLTYAAFTVASTAEVEIAKQSRRLACEASSSLPTSARSPRWRAATVASTRAFSVITCLARCASGGVKGSIISNVASRRLATPSSSHARLHSARRSL